jgi:hypothetical protein
MHGESSAGDETGKNKIGKDETGKDRVGTAPAGMAGLNRRARGSGAFCRRAMPGR